MHLIFTAPYIHLTIRLIYTHIIFTLHLPYLHLLYTTFTFYFPFYVSHFPLFTDFVSEFHFAYFYFPFFFLLTIFLSFFCFGLSVFRFLSSSNPPTHRQRRQLKVIFRRSRTPSFQRFSVSACHVVITWPASWVVVAVEQEAAYCLISWPVFQSFN